MKPQSDAIFLLGIAGVGMESLGRYLLQRGYTVYGWDDCCGEAYLQSLKQNFKIQSCLPENVTVCVYSAAIPQDHPLLKEAHARGINVECRGIYLSHILDPQQDVVAVTGSHGKSSVTAYLIHFFRKANLPCSYILGAHFENNCYPMGHWDPQARYAVVEWDESDGSIEHCCPQYSVLLNDDWDHPQHYVCRSDYQAVFERLAKRSERLVFLGPDMPSYNFKASIQLGRDVSWQETQHGFELKIGNEVITYETQHFFALENVVMALVVFHTLVGQWPDLNCLKSFPGIQRRQTVLLNLPRLTVIHDYAHHPTELKRYLDFIENNYNDRKHFLCFEPHRPSRLKAFYKDFLGVLAKIKHLYLMNTYDAFEEESTKTFEALCRDLPQAQLCHALSDFFSSNDDSIVVSFVGAGCIENKAQTWLNAWVESTRVFIEKVSGVVVKSFYNLRHKSTLGLNGSCLYYTEIEEENSLQKLVKILRELDIPYYVLGSGSNVLFPDIRYDGMVIQIKAPKHQKIQVKANVCRVNAGTHLKGFLDALEDAGYGGLEFLEGIPGTLGGALRMNAGTAQQGIWDRVEQITYVDVDGTIKVCSRDSIDVQYRDCLFLKNKIVTDVLFKLEPSTQRLVHEKRQHYRQLRAHQPHGKSLGCFFKNPPGLSAGKLLDDLGIGSWRIGGAYVSEKHANFLMNNGNACFNDFVQLVRKIRKYVWEKTKISLSLEVKILGKEWKEYE